MVKLVGRKKETPPLDSINYTIQTPRKKKEDLTEVEKTLLGKMVQAYLKQYPLKTKGKNPDKYAFSHIMAEALQTKMIQIKMLNPKEERT